MTNDGKKLSDYAKKSIKAFGEGAIITANKMNSLDIPRISSGVYPLDKALGGGWPVGRFSMIYGPESSGKTSLFLRGAASAQRTCANCNKIGTLNQCTIPNVDFSNGSIDGEIDTWLITECECGNPQNYSVAWIDQEGVWDGKWAEILGVFTERLILSRPQFAEQAVDIIESLIYDKIADIIIIDSLAAFSSQAEIQNATGDASIGEGARILNRAFRKWTSAIHASWREKITKDENIIVPTIWMTNQVRQKVGVLFGNPEVRPGGLGQGFVTSVEVRTSGGKSAKDYKQEDDDSVDVKLKFQCKKNKTAPAMKKGEYRMVVRDTEIFSVGEVIDYDDVFNDALRHGIIEQISTRKFSFNGHEYSSKKSLKEEWVRDKDLYREVKSELLKLV